MNNVIIRNGRMVKPRNRYSKRGNEVVRLQDPIAILTAGYGLLQSIFPGIFGGTRKRLTEADWLQLFPGNGYWTTQLRNFLKARIHYDVDMKFAYPFFSEQLGRQDQGHISFFVLRHKDQICPGKVTPQCDSMAQLQGIPCQPCMTEFANILKQEQFSGGNQPVGQYPGGLAPGGTMDWYSIIPIVAVGAVMLIALKGKRRGRK